MRNITCIIVDDEPPALALLEGYIARTPFLELVGKCTSPYQAMQILQSVKVDLVFLDIQMPGVTGIELSRVIQNGPRVVFTTAYSQYALEGFKVDALDYLVKPFNYEEFIKAANKALAWFGRGHGETEQSSHSEASIFVKSDYKLVKIDLDKILYVEGLKDYLKIYTIDHPKPILTIMTLKTMEEKLPANMFMRVHRSFIVNLTKISTVDRSRIVFDKVYIPIAESYKEKFNIFISQRSLS